ncbi:MAG: restriction endonuclease subunit S [Spirosomataceae bacterium]
MKGDTFDRIDPLYYKKSDSLNIVNLSKYPKTKLSTVTDLLRGRFSHRPRNEPRFYDGKYPFIQTGDIVKASNEGSEIEYTQTLNEEGLKVSKLFNPPTLVITIAANIGDTAILNYPACFPDSLVTIKPKNENLRIDYLNIYFKYLKNYLNEIAPQAAQKNLNIQQLSPTPIIIPPLEIQNQIVEKYNQAVEAKRQKEAEAKAHLASIDGYLLDKLGIILPQTTENPKFYYSKFSKVVGRRFDPKPYLPSNYELKESIKKSKYPIKPLKALITQSVAGDWGIDEAQDGFEERLVIRATEFDNFYNLNLENDRVKYRFINQTKLSKMDLQTDDLLIEKSGGSENQPVGRIAIITNDLTQNYKLAYSNFIHKIRIIHNVSAEFIYFYLKTIHNIKITDLMQSQTNGIRNLIMHEYLSIPVSLPPIEIQNEIAEHIRVIREKAKALENEAKELLETAKAEVERMILGE